MNLYHLTGFDSEKALQEWELVFKELKEYVEDKEVYKCTIIVANDAHEYEERQNSKGEWFTPSSNKGQEFTVFVKQKPLVDEFSKCTIEDVQNAYVAGDRKRGRAIFEADRLVKS